MTPYYYSYQTPLGPYGLIVSLNLASLTTPPTTLLTAPERFELVSSLYGPGNLLCWFLLLLSVLASWTLNPRTARRDTITNDFLAVLTLPLVAVAHLLHQIYSHGRPRDLFTGLNRDAVRAVAAIEAPLAVCEGFVVCASVMYCVAAWRGQRRRMAMVLGVGGLCLAAQVPMWVLGLGYGPGGSSLVRPYVFQADVVFGVLVGCYGVMVGVWVVEMVWGVLREATGDGVVGGLWPGRVSRWMAAGLGVVVAGCGVGIKYGGMYKAEWRFHAFRFVPKGVARMGDLDQVVAVLGGLVTLGFSGWDVYRSRRMAGQRGGDVESISLRALRGQGGDRVEDYIRRTGVASGAVV